MNFEIPPELAELRQQVRRFIAEQVIPLERDPRNTAHGPEASLRLELVERAREAGVLAPQVNVEYGGRALDQRARAVIFEEAGYSPLGPLALNIAAPDEGNMHLLELIATEEQKHQWLRPLATARWRSCFCMTEPAPGSGSDPSMLQTVAIRDGDDYLISGRKWLITGAQGADFAIVIAKLEDGRATMFLTEMNRPGITVERLMDTLDSCFIGGHGVVVFDELRVPAKNILGELGEGLRYAQYRLSPARLSHCMRWLGAARRAHDVAADYARKREAFGKLIGKHEGVGFMLADNDIDLHQSRLMIWATAWVLDRGDLGLFESSRAKVAVSEALWRVVDRSVQILGGQGVTHETVVARIFADMRGFRIYDGPSEVHRWSIAGKVLKNPTLSEVMP